jgi:osmotically-inducible protein OsmY|tara:strand:+ start:46 stop:738 length:693 start_codon:yes stop_codon:yes gene_type:complete
MITSSILSSCAPIVQGAAAVTTVATMSNDRRTMGEILDDKTLFIDLGNIVAKDPMLEDAHINFNVFNQAVLMTGEAPDDNAKDYLESIVKSKSAKISQLMNEVEVMPKSSYIDRAKDGVITVQIETLFLNQEVFHPSHVSVRTERKVVYLMGSVTKREAEHATNIASKAKNVKKVVKLFNYLLVRPAKEVEKDNKKKEVAMKRAELEDKLAEQELIQNELTQQLFELGSD